MVMAGSEQVVQVSHPENRLLQPVTLPSAWTPRFQGIHGLLTHILSTEEVAPHLPHLGATHSPQDTPPTCIYQCSTHLLFRHGVEVLAVRAEDQVTKDGATFLGHYILVGQGWPAARVGQVHQDLWH